MPTAKNVSMALRWTDPEVKGSVDIFQADAFKALGELPELTHQVRGPKGGTSEARCRVAVHSRYAELNYEAFAAFNRSRGMYSEVLRLHFADADRTQLLKAEWRDQHEAAFRKAHVKPIRYTLERAAPYQPGAIGSTRVIRRLRERPGQQRFRADLKMAYGGRCCISGCTVSETLEAAHIDPYGGRDFDHLQNGLLLRLDLHRLFDAGKLAVEPITREIHFAEDVMEWREYRELRRRVLLEPASPNEWCRPDATALKRRWEVFSRQRHLTHRI